MVLVEQRVWSWWSRGCGLSRAEDVVLVEQRMWNWLWYNSNSTGCVPPMLDLLAVQSPKHQKCEVQITSLQFPTRISTW